MAKRTNNNRQRNAARSSQKLAVPVRDALRSIRRQMNDESILVNGPNDPRPIRADVCVTKVVEDATLTAAKSYTYANIYKLLDAGTTPFFTQIRVIGLSAFGSNDAAGGSIGVVVDQDAASFIDRGVTGQRRPALHVRLPERTRIQWNSVSAGGTLFTVTPSASTGNVVQVTIEVRGDASGNS